jgi:alkanesulfonate monooxygenase SsuD/methylene tetrahydromethanopterin reductase-like flavin-dependent oxidoreductase (luciferase family)
MQFGIFDHMEQAPVEAGKRLGGNLAALYEGRLRMLEFADASGFARYHKAEHHFTTLDAAPSSSVFLSAAAQRTKRIRLGSLVMLLPFYHPVRLIEEICALDHLSGGRLDVGVGKGISPVEHGIWGNPADEATARTVEILEILRAGLVAENLTHRGRFYSFDSAPMTMAPLQQPHPPIWYPGNVEFAGAHRLNTVVGGPLSTVTAQVKRFAELVKSPQADWNPGVASPVIGALRHVIVAPTREAAIERARRAWAAYDRNLMSLWRAHGVEPSGSPSLNGNFDMAMSLHVALACTPDDMLAHVRELRDEAGLEYFVASFAWGDLTHEEAVESMQLFAKAVLPAFSR